AQGLRITRALREIEDLRAPLPETLPGLESPALRRAWSMLRILRGFAAEYCHADRNPSQMDIALLRYAVHTLSFDESSPLQKQWPLAASCGLAEDVIATRRSEQRLRIDWVDWACTGNAAPRGKLGLTICPGRRDRGRNLTADLDVLSSEKAARVVCLLT